MCMYKTVFNVCVWEREQKGMRVGCVVLKLSLVISLWRLIWSDLSVRQSAQMSGFEWPYVHHVVNCWNLVAGRLICQRNPSAHCCCFPSLSLYSMELSFFPTFSQSLPCFSLYLSLCLTHTSLYICLFSFLIHLIREKKFVFSVRKTEVFCVVVIRYNEMQTSIFIYCTILYIYNA